MLSLCGPSGRMCYEDVLKDKTSCLMPCKGFYADMRINHYGESSLLTKENIKDKRLILEYANFKGRMVDSEGFSVTYIISNDIEGT